MSRERDGGREPRKGPDRGKAVKSAAPLHFEEGREESPLEPRPPAKGARGGKQAEPLRFGPEQEPEPSAPKQRRLDWKKASARKVREATAPAEPERREETAPQGDGHQPASEAGAAPENSGGHPDPLEGRADRFPPDRVAECASPREGPAARLRFEDEDAAPGSQPDKAAPKGPRPAGRGPSYSQDAPANAPPEAPMGQSVP